MKISIKCLIVISLLISTLFSCKKGGSNGPDPVIPDTTKPTITISKPTAGQLFVPGNTITFQATFTDNVKLKSYEISISKVVLGGLTLKNVPVSVPWSYAKSSTSLISGAKQQVINLNDIIIPLDITGKPVATGKYNFKVTCIDDSNNIAETTIDINFN